MTATAIKERPILMNSEMVRAALSDRKTQTRRIVKPQPEMNGEIHGKAAWWWPTKRSEAGYVHTDFNSLVKIMLGECPFGQVGDRLWVREPWRKVESGLNAGKADYRADDPAASGTGFIPWKPSIHMPRHCSRITLELTGVKVERLQEISEEDAKAEGITPMTGCAGTVVGYESVAVDSRCLAMDAFGDLWDSIYGANAWDRNDWVWAIEFKRLEQA